MPHVSYFWDEIEDNVVEEYDGDSGATIASYTTEPTRYGSVLSQDRGGEKRYFQCDGQGSTTELTDETGCVTDTRRYAAFGTPTSATGLTVCLLSWNGASGYATERHQASCYIRRRTYSDVLGRWYSSDPNHAIDGPNYYWYARSSPNNMIDPDGLLAVIREKMDYVNRCAPAKTVGVWEAFSFALNATAPCDGYFFQYLRVRSWLRKCPCTVEGIDRRCIWGTDITWQQGADSQVEYYEWFGNKSNAGAGMVYKGNTVFHKDDAVAHSALWDERKIRGNKDLCGIMRFDAEVRFYCKSSIYFPTTTTQGTYPQGLPNPIPESGVLTGQRHF